MGIVRMGPPNELIEELAKQFSEVNSKLWKEYGRPSFYKGIDLINLSIKNTINRLKFLVKKAIKK